MHKTSLSVMVATAVVGVALHAQEARLLGPELGLIFDEFSGSIRRMIGLPGAAYLGAPAAKGLSKATISPSGTVALGVKQGVLFLVKLSAQEASWETLEPDAGVVHSIVWSADSSAVLVVGPTLRIWRDLLHGPKRTVLTSVDVGDRHAFAVEPRGDAVLAATEGGVYRVSAAESRLVVPLGSPGGLLLDASAEVAYVADRSAKQVLAIRKWGDSAEVSLVAGESSAIEDPVALAAWGDGRSLLVANSSSRSIIRVDSRSGNLLQHWNLDFEPTRLDHFAAGLYLLNGRKVETDSLRILSKSPLASVYFVPVRLFPGLAEVSFQ